MISAEEALERILQAKLETGTEEVVLLQSIGRVLHQEVVADRDFPPYNRVMMDGIAIVAATYDAGCRTFPIEKIQAAGMAQQGLLDPQKCIEVMTGAVLPEGTDRVIPYEQCEIQNGVATISSNSASGQPNVHARATDCKKGDILLQKGAIITPAMIGLMASVGLAVVQVRRFPAITICSTGDELVEVEQQPEAHQVRRSNLYMLAAALATEGVYAATVHLPDDPAQMRKDIDALIPINDAILFSGAVSRGKYDFLPSVLSGLGMETIFHTVAQRPGKPFLFGQFSNGPLIFGFPGNPVSTFACYHQFFKKWLHASLGVTKADQARLAEDVQFKPSLAHHLLVKLQTVDGSLVASPVVGSTSGDLVTLVQADGIITLPAARDFFPKGEVFEVNLLH